MNEEKNAARKKPGRVAWLVLMGVSAGAAGFMGAVVVTGIAVEKLRKLAGRGDDDARPAERPDERRST